MHTFTEAATSLGLTNHRKWRKCLTVAGLLPGVSEGDKRRKLLSDDDMETLRRTRDTLWPTYATASSHSEGQQVALPTFQTSTHVYARIEALERRVSALESALRRQEPSRATQTVDDTPSDIPVGSIRAGPFAVANKISETTLRRWIADGYVEAVSIPSRIKAGEKERWLTPIGQQQALERGNR